MTGLLPYRNIFPRLGENVFVAPGAWIIGDVVIGPRSSVWFNTVIRGDEHYVRIGSETNIQDNCTLHVTEGEYPLEIGNRVTIGHRAIVHGSVVEDDCMIGMGSIVMDGCRIGKGSLVAAGSVVTMGTLVPPGSLVMGIPATVRKEITEKERRRMQESVAHYLRLREDYLEPEVLRVRTQVKGFLRD